MKKILKFLKRIWVLNFIRRIFFASKYFNKKYWQILKWGFKSKEDTNYTFHLTKANLSYMIHAISVVTGKKYSEILYYIKEAEDDMELKNYITEAIQKSNYKKFADLEIRFGKRLGWYAFVRTMKPKIVIETGVDKGLGSVILCSAILKNRDEGFEGQYFGTDINPSAGYLLDGKYKAAGQILYGDSIETLTKFKDTIDLFINDSDHSTEYEYQEYQTIKHLITDDSVILGDNSHCSDKLALFSIETNRNFLFFKEEPLNHWYPGAGIGISFKH